MTFFHRYKTPLIAAGVAAVLLVAMPVFLAMIFLGANLSGTSNQANRSIVVPNGNWAALDDIPGPALSAYMQFSNKSGTCNIPWWLLAGIGRKETNHGRFSWFPPDTMWFQEDIALNQLGQTILVDKSGQPLEPTQYVRGIPLDGSMAGTAVVLLGNGIPDQANGMMQVLTNFFITKQEQGIPSPSGDAVWDPYNLWDNVGAAAYHLCERQNGYSGIDLSANPEFIRSAIWSYNPSQDYVNRVLEYATRYRGLTPVQIAEPVGSFTPAPAGGGTIVNVGGIEVDASIAANLNAMIRAAASEGVVLAGTGFRNPAEQVELRKAYCGTTEYDIWQKPSWECTPAVAIPGSSMHEQGLAIDFENNGWGWLARNAARFGFFANVPGEPWHYSTTGN